jgi:hypothetical protein|nr:MAG TPA: hypothetical protein [Caudoviricetes sp.]
MRLLRLCRDYETLPVSTLRSLAGFSQKTGEKRLEILREIWGQLRGVASPGEPQKDRHWTEKTGRGQHGGHLESGTNGRYSRLDVGLYSGICQ